ncbi:hypothetical protein [Tenacibaculum aquimarinum]|uniref:hypothetical protein n=1 Tax=Tenacibaculum aquimarinum TaxID=2910675 RepID=UPI001F0B07CB|nr:hypothetical protein [Tenacibaculum aquimarinum]MCH3884903.1 hypothetical protein [Tenacibaculum aquimarinum]
MKKGILLLVLLFITTLGFSQNKIGGDDPIPGIDIIIKKTPEVNLYQTQETTL